MSLKTIYPAMIRNLPEADIPFEGVKGHLLQGASQQVVYFEIEAIGEVAEHKHGAQWGLVIEGEMDLTIDGSTKTYKKGDTYFIPEGVLHSAVFKTKSYIMDVFADKHRYDVKTKAV